MEQDQAAGGRAGGAGGVGSRHWAANFLVPLLFSFFFNVKSGHVVLDEIFPFYTLMLYYY